MVNPILVVLIWGMLISCIILLVWGTEFDNMGYISCQNMVIWGNISQYGVTLSWPTSALLYVLCMWPVHASSSIQSMHIPVLAVNQYVAHM